jgi:hypothetical protein
MRPPLPLLTLKTATQVRTAEDGWNIEHPRFSDMAL